MEGDIHGVRIEPQILMFDNTVPGNLYTVEVVVKNVSGKGKKIRYYGSKDKVCIYEQNIDLYVIILLSQAVVCCSNILQSNTRLTYTL